MSPTHAFVPSLPVLSHSSRSVSLGLPRTNVAVNSHRPAHVAPRPVPTMTVTSRSSLRRALLFQALSPANPLSTVLRRPLAAVAEISATAPITTTTTTTNTDKSTILTVNSAAAAAVASPILLHKQYHHESDYDENNSIKPSPMAKFSRSVARQSRLTLALAHRLATRLSAFRRRNHTALKLVRLSATLSLAAVSFFVTRTALVPATAPTPLVPSLPSLPSLPFKITMPPRIAEILKPFTEAFGVVFLSEFGDKSMFATALMAMKHNPLIVCIGALAALTLMTFIACFLGQLMHYLPATVTHYSSIALFVFFGLQMILQARQLPDTPGGTGGERADAEELVAEAAVAQEQSPLTVLAKVSSLIFVAEWCDRSMLATMALAASSNTVAVIGGASFANVLCTGMAVCAATLVASRISERVVALIAGVLFEVFAVFTYLEGPEG